MPCRDCIHLDVPRGEPREHRIYRCRVEVPASALPDCMTAAANFREPFRVPLPPSAGEHCRYHEPMRGQ